MTSLWVIDGLAIICEGCNTEESITNSHTEMNLCTNCLNKIQNVTFTQKFEGTHMITKTDKNFNFMGG